jgi:hypothetical protein
MLLLGHKYIIINTWSWAGIRNHCDPAPEPMHDHPLVLASVPTKLNLSTTKGVRYWQRLMNPPIIIIIMNSPYHHHCHHDLIPAKITPGDPNLWPPRYRKLLVQDRYRRQFHIITIINDMVLSKLTSTFLTESVTSEVPDILSFSGRILVPPYLIKCLTARRMNLWAPVQVLSHPVLKHCRVQLAQSSNNSTCFILNTVNLLFQDRCKLLRIISTIHNMLLSYLTSKVLTEWFCDFRRMQKAASTVITNTHTSIDLNLITTEPLP